MLAHLTIRNFALVDQLDISLDAGLIVVTGESGAGKSILLDAIGLVLGARVSKSYIRANVDQCEVTAEFDVAANEPALAYLADHDLMDPDAPNRCLVRRIARPDGRSRAYVNGTPVNLGVLREFCSPLVEIHGQHENQRLLDHTVQLQWLDDFGVDAALKDATRVAFVDWKQAQSELDDLATRTADAAERFDLLSYQVDELEGLDLHDQEFEQLTSRHKRLSQGKDLQERLASVLDEVGDHVNATTRMANVLDEVDDDHAALTNARELLRTAEAHLDEAKSELRVYDDSLNVDEQTLDDLDQRLSAIHDIARKHRVAPTDLHSRAGDLRAELDAMSFDESRLQELQSSVAALEATYLTAAGRLSKVRRRAAKPFAKAITAAFAQLGMPQASIGIEFADAQSESGLESVEYVVTTNPKYPPGTLKELASGGELSRISLAIQVVAAAQSNLPCLILDEADVGVGGTTADVVGRMLRNVAGHTQVVCVTHAPQVAALGDSHLLVEKTKTQDTRVSAISGSDRIEELARMLGGREVTDDTRTYARTLYDEAQVA